MDQQLVVDVNWVYFFMLPPHSSCVRCEASTMLQVNSLYTAHKDVLSERSYSDNSIDSIRANMQWLESNAPVVCAWLQQA